MPAPRIADHDHLLQRCAGEDVVRKAFAAAYAEHLPAARQRKSPRRRKGDPAARERPWPQTRNDKIYHARFQPGLGQHGRKRGKKLLVPEPGAFPALLRQNRLIVQQSRAADDCRLLYCQGDHMRPRGLPKTQSFMTAAHKTLDAPR